MEFGMYLKTYRDDLNRVKVLIDSFNQYNKDSILLFISVPETDIYLFNQFMSNNIHILSDEDYASPWMTSTPICGIRPGYINQQICKLTFYTTKYCENYLCLDSDMIFIRDFYITDFMKDNHTPYTVLVMDKELSIQRYYRNTYWNSRQKQIEKIYKFFGSNDLRLRTCHNGQIFNSQILRSLYLDFMQQKGITYFTLMEIAPLEFAWYNAYFQYSNLITEYACEPFFYMFHTYYDYYLSKARLLRKQDFALAYVGIVMNNKWMGGTPYN